jgi:hypothetical protein
MVSYRLWGWFYAVSNLSTPIPAEIKGFESLTFDVRLHGQHAPKGTLRVLISVPMPAHPYRLGVAGGGSTLNLSYSNSEIVDYRLTANAYELGYHDKFKQSDTVTFTQRREVCH